MGAIRDFSLADYLQAIKSNLGESQINSTALNKVETQLNSVFAEAAANDDGEDKNVLETDYDEFQNLVQQGLKLVKNKLTEMGIPLDGNFTLFTNGEIPGKENGVQGWDTLQQYQGGKLVSVKEGIDENNDRTLTDSEVQFTNHPDAETGIPEHGNYTVFTSGNIPGKENGAQNWDTVKRFENGKLVKVIEGIDYNEDGALTGDEIVDKSKINLNFGL